MMDKFTAGQDVRVNDKYFLKEYLGLGGTIICKIENVHPPSLKRYIVRFNNGEQMGIGEEYLEAVSVDTAQTERDAEAYNIESLAADYVAHELERAKKTLLEFADIDVATLQAELEATRKQVAAAVRFRNYTAVWHKPDGSKVLCPVTYMSNADWVQEFELFAESVTTPQPAPAPAGELVAAMDGKPSPLMLNEEVASSDSALVAAVGDWFTPGTPEYVVLSFFTAKSDEWGAAITEDKTLWSYEPFVIEAERRGWVTLSTPHYNGEGRSVWATLNNAGRIAFSQWLLKLMITEFESNQ